MKEHDATKNKIKFDFLSYYHLLGKKREKKIL
jgi:hypothetical protein